MSKSDPIYDPEIYGSSSKGGTLTISGSGPGAPGGDVHINPNGGKTGIGTSNPANTLSVDGNADFSGSITFPSGVTATSVAQHLKMLTGRGKWIVPTWITCIKVTLVGGGGAGSYSKKGSIATGGGGAGGVLIRYIQTKPGDSIPYSVGNGGTSTITTSTNGEDTTFGTIAALGGKCADDSYQGGAGGTVKNDSPEGISIDGQPGFDCISEGLGLSGQGGSGPYGFGGAAAIGNATGRPASGYGAGGGGASVSGEESGPYAGGNGSNGVIIIEY